MMGPGATGPGATTMRRPGGDSGVGMDQLTPAGGVVNRSRLAAPVYVERHDPLAGAFGGLALFGTLVVLFGGFVVANAVFNVQPDLVKGLTGPDGKGLIYLGGALVLGVILAGVGWMMGKSA